jgi:hypothetical protein
MKRHIDISTICLVTLRIHCSRTTHLTTWVTKVWDPRVSLVTRLLRFTGLMVLLGYRLIEEGCKEPDSCIVPHGSKSPSIIVEAGSSETLARLRNDAERWLESERLHVSQFYLTHCYFLRDKYPQVQMVIIISIDPPIAPNLNIPRITIEHWKTRPPLRPQRPGTAARWKVAFRAWHADWTLAVSANYYILLADMFGSTPIPAVYGAHTRLTFSPADVAGWRQGIIDEWRSQYS